jgi:hypothetical protein
MKTSNVNAEVFMRRLEFNNILLCHCNGAKITNSGLRRPRPGACSSRTSMCASMDGRLVRAFFRGLPPFLEAGRKIGLERTSPAAFYFSYRMSP